MPQWVTVDGVFGIGYALCLVETETFTLEEQTMSGFSHLSSMTGRSIFDEFFGVGEDMTFNIDAKDEGAHCHPSRSAGGPQE